MAQHDRCMLNKHDIERFKTWLTENRITWREGKGDFQILQVKQAKGWGAICTDAKGVITTPPALRAMIQHFQAGKPYPVKAAAKPVENQQFLQDLWDDAALRAMQSLIINPDAQMTTGLHPACIAHSAANFADAFMAERAKRTTN